MKDNSVLGHSEMPQNLYLLKNFNLKYPAQPVSPWSLPTMTQQRVILLVCGFAPSDVLSL
jgi:hypothetical protein